MTGYNLKSIKTVSSFEFPVKDHDGNPTGVVFVLAGPTHPAREAVEMARNRRLIQAANKTGRVTLPDPAEIKASRVKELAACTLGWTGYADETGQPVAYSTATAEALYADPEMLWLTDQVEEALGNKSLYTKPASAS